MKLVPRSDPKAIQRAVLRIRGQNVLLDSDLAVLYGVNVKALNQAVKRNALRFPPDFMFQLDAAETAPLRSQIVTAKQGRGGRRTTPYAFTEQGVAMLSSVLRSSRAIEVNVEIMRTFVRRAACWPCTTMWAGSWTRSSGSTTASSAWCLKPSGN